MIRIFLTKPQTALYRRACAGYRGRIRHNPAEKAGVIGLFKLPEEAVAVRDQNSLGEIIAGPQPDEKTSYYTKD